ncbi:hypothetical protein [Priestia megaterium]|uniref:hypothetical protein n=1 Tax=Priestia megaterium TaxID=1404 RepID=UPI002E1AB050|nr:hypothetical protein [Priestia megaterium]
MARLPKTIEFFKQMQSDVRKMDYHDANEAQAHCLISEHYCSEVIEALEKQIPKKPDIEGDGYDSEGNLICDTWICPCCRHTFEINYDVYKYCPDCGQRLDLSEVSWV